MEKREVVEGIRVFLFSFLSFTFGKFLPRKVIEYFLISFQEGERMKSDFIFLINFIMSYNHIFVYLSSIG